MANKEGEEEEEKLEYYNEYVMIPTWTPIGVFNYIVFFPVNLLLCLLFWGFHKPEKQTPNKLAYYTFMALLLLGFLSYLLAYWSALISISVEWLTVETMAFTFGAWGLQMFYLYYNIKLSKHQDDMKHYAFIIYFRQVGLFKIGFGLGFVWLLLTLFTSYKLSIRESPYRF